MNLQFKVSDLQNIQEFYSESRVFQIRSIDESRVNYYIKFDSTTDNLQVREQSMHKSEFIDRLNDGTFSTPLKTINVETPYELQTKLQYDTQLKVLSNGSVLFSSLEPIDNNAAKVVRHFVRPNDRTFFEVNGNIKKSLLSKLDQEDLSSINEHYSNSENLDTPDQNLSSEKQESALSYDDKTIDKVLNMSLDDEDVKQILELEKLRNQGKELNKEQKEKILNNPHISDEKKLVLLTFMNDKNPTKTMTDHYAELSKQANDDVSKKTGRDLHSSQTSSKANKGVRSVANAIEKTSRFTVD